MYGVIDRQGNLSYRHGDLMEALYALKMDFGIGDRGAHGGHNSARRGFVAIGRAFMTDTAKRASRCYARNMLVASAIYAAFVFAGASAIRHLNLRQWAVICIALAPLAPAMLMLRAEI